MRRPSKRSYSGKRKCKGRQRPSFGTDRPTPALKRTAEYSEAEAASEG